MLRDDIVAALRDNARVVDRSAAAGLRPDPRMRVSEWAERHRMVSAEASVLPGRWNNAVAPELVEIMDRLSPDDPCDNVRLMKCAQSGGSETACNWLGFIAHKTPGPAMYVGPTVKAAKDWKVEKLDPTIAATEALNPARGGVVIAQKSRSGEGSVADRLRFKGGYVLFAGANSAATLRQHSIRFMVRDDRSAWTDDAEGEGDPKNLSDQRLKTYRRFGLAKALDISTPVEKGSDIDREYEQSDRRRFYVACKNDDCGTIHDLLWEDIRREKDVPYRSRWVCPVCTAEHMDSDKRVMKSLARGATWIPTVPDADGVVPPKSMHRSEAARWRAPHEHRSDHSYVLTGEITTFETWDELARQEHDAGDDPELQKPFCNSGLGRAWEAKGEGPPWEVLAARREASFRRGVAPLGAGYFTMGVDKQHDGLYWQRLGWGPRKECWVIDFGYLSGATDAMGDGAWRKLDMVAERGFVLESGARLADDLILLDSGDGPDPVYEWVRRHHTAIATKGEDGWSKPAIFRAKTAEVKKSGLSAGKARRYGILVWLIGTYGLKAALMIYLGRTPLADKAGFPTGYIHFPGDAEDEFFRHLCSEYVKVEMTSSGPERRWVRRSANHWLDTHVLNMAGAHHAGIWTWSEERWEKRFAELASLTKTSSPDLFSATDASHAVAAGPIDDADDEAEAATPAQPLATALKKADRLGLGALKKLNQ